MSRPYTTKITFSGWKNVKAALEADGAVSLPPKGTITVVNMTTTIAYLHQTSDGGTNPTTAANGLPFSTDTTASPSSTITLEKADLATTWINTGGSIAITISVS